MEDSRVIKAGRNTPKVEEQPTEVEALKEKLEQTQNYASALSENLAQFMDFMLSNLPNT